MKKDKVELIFLVDRSGSMNFNNRKEQVVSEFNKLIKKQRELDGECLISFFQFDDEFEKVFETKNLKDVELMKQVDFVPRGMTALYDSIVKCINNTGERLKNTKESERPEKVIVAVITDGEENASTENDYSNVKEVIQHQEDKYNWSVVFLSEDLQAVEDSQRMFRSSNTMGVASVGKGVSNVSNYLYSMRSSGDYSQTLDSVKDENKTEKTK